MNEVGSWLVDLYGSNTGFWVNAVDVLGQDNGGLIMWTDGSSVEAVDASFWLTNEPDHGPSYKDCVYLKLENDPGLAMENCDEGHLYPLCKI